MAISNTGAMRKALASPAVQGAVRQKVGKGCLPSALRPVGVKNVSEPPSTLEHNTFFMPRASVDRGPQKWASEYKSASFVGPRYTGPFVIPKATCSYVGSYDLGRAHDVNPPPLRRASDFKVRSDPHLKGLHQTPFSNRTWPGTQPSAPMVLSRQRPRAVAPSVQELMKNELLTRTNERSEQEKGSVGNRNPGPSYHFDNMRRSDEGGYGVQNKVRLCEVEKNNMQREKYRYLATKPLNFVPLKQDVVMVREAPLRGILKNAETPSRPKYRQLLCFDNSDYSTPCYSDYYRDHYSDSDSDSDCESESESESESDYGSEVN